MFTQEVIARYKGHKYTLKVTLDKEAKCLTELRSRLVFTHSFASLYSSNSPII